MGIWIIPVRMKAADIYIDAPRPEVFSKLTSFTREDAATGPAVLAREESGSLLVEFRTTVTGLLGRKKTHRTIERVTLMEPLEISFDGIEGPLALLRDRISLAAENGGTRVRYESTVGLRGSILGWLLAVLYVKRVLGAFMIQHLRQLKESTERDT